jgi:hypothetical protein
MLRLEFLHYDTEGLGWVPGVDFGRSMVAAADLKAVDGLLDKASGSTGPAVWALSMAWKRGA